MPELVVVVFGMLVILAAGLIQGTTGFGFMMVSIPLITIFIDPHLAVPVMLIQVSVTSIPIMLHARRHLRIRRMWMMALAGMAGVPIGTLLLRLLDASILRLFIGALVTAAAIAMLFGFRKTLGRERVASVPIVFASGVLGAATGLAGPPVILFYNNQSIEPQEFRANLVAYFIMLDVVTLPSFFIAGLFTREAILLGVYLLPASLLGILAGIGINRLVKERLFRYIALFLIIASGIIAIATGISGA